MSVNYSLAVNSVSKDKDPERETENKCRAYTELALRQARKEEEKR